MNLMFVNSTIAWGGVKTWMLEYGGKLVERGHKVVICARKDGPFIDACTSRGLIAYPVNFGADFNPITILSFVNLIKKENIDIVCTNIEKDNRLAGIAAKIRGKKVVQRVGLVSDISDKLKFRLVQKFIIQKMIVPCHYIKSGLKPLKWLDQDKIVVIHNGKDTKDYLPGKYYSEIREELGVSREEILIGVSSQIRESKGHTYLLKAFSLLINKYPLIKLAIIGKGPDLKTIEDEIKKLDLLNSVILTGYRSDINRVIDAFDIAALPSLEEGLPNTVVEYMAMGKPVVASDIAGIPELVENGVTGFLAPAADEVKLAEMIEKFIADKNMRRNFGDAGRKRIEKLFNLNDKVSQLEQTLENTFQGR